MRSGFWLYIATTPEQKISLLISSIFGVGFMADSTLQIRHNLLHDEIIPTVELQIDINEA